MTAAELRKAPSGRVVRVEFMTGLTAEGWGGFAGTFDEILYQLTINHPHFSPSQGRLLRSPLFMCTEIKSITPLRRTERGWKEERDD